MSIGIITGSGTHSLPGLAIAETLALDTPFGPAQVSAGRLADVDVVHVSRHGPRHARLSNQVSHQANIWALNELEATAVIGCTACGAVDATLALGSLVVFDDLHFPSNRLADGSLCTFFTEAGDPARGHWILHGGPFSEDLRATLLTAASQAGHPARDGGVYGHVDGPRFNTPAEIAELASSGVVAVSQTAGPEAVLCGELELPFALVGFVTDYANEVVPGEPTPLATLSDLMGRSSSVFADVLTVAVGRLAGGAPAPAGTMFRFEQA